MKRNIAKGTNKVNKGKYITDFINKKTYSKICKRISRENAKKEIKTQLKDYFN